MVRRRGGNGQRGRCDLPRLDAPLPCGRRGGGRNRSTTGASGYVKGKGTRNTRLRKGADGIACTTCLRLMVGARDFCARRGEGPRGSQSDSRTSRVADLNEALSVRGKDEGDEAVKGGVAEDEAGAAWVGVESGRLGAGPVE